MSAVGSMDIIIDEVDALAAGFPVRTMPKILCCMCGVEIDSNPANMCVNCLRSQVDITEGISKQVVIHQCRGCGRYLRPPWVSCELESKELLAVCLKKITGLNKVKLIDAGFIWTEPHSRRIKVKLTIQKEVLNGVKLQQVFPVEFMLQNQQCDACQRSYTDHVWRAMVQVRQDVDHKKTFFLLEQLILRHGVHEKCISIEQTTTGVDFAFSERSHARKFMDFLGSVVPTRSKDAKQLISEDVQNGSATYKYTSAVEIVPLCKDDVVVLPAKTAAQLGHLSPLALVLRVSSLIYLVDPRSLQVAELTADKYWREPFRPLVSQQRLEEFTVLDVTPVTIAPITGTALRRKQGSKARKPRPAALARLAEERSLESMSSRGGMSGAASITGSLAGTKRKRSTGGDGDDGASTWGTNTHTAFSGGFTGAVSLAGGSIQFNAGASTVASTVTGGPRGKFLLADVEVMKTADMGTTDTRYIVRTHLGNILRPGDTVLGYDLCNAVYNDADAEASAIGGKNRTRGTHSRGGAFDMPDVVLVRKVLLRRWEREAKEAAEEAEARGVNTLSTETGAGVAAPAASSGGMADDEEGGASAEAAAAVRRRRMWKLQRLDAVVPTTRSTAMRRGEEERDAADFESFLREIEEDPALRKTINLYKDSAAIAAAGGADAVRAAAKRSAPTSSSAAAAAAKGATAKLLAASKAKAKTGGAAHKAALRAAAAAAAADDDEEDDDGSEYDDEDEEDDEEGGAGGGYVEEIGLEELLDDMSLGAGSGVTVDPEDEAVLAALRGAKAKKESSGGGAGVGGPAPGTSVLEADLLGAHPGKTGVAHDVIQEEEEDDDL